MIDTIVLTLDSNHYQIIDPYKFNPPASWIKKAYHHIKSKQNPTQKELRKGIYKPRLTLFNRFSKNNSHTILLKIEFSLPKLLFGNNFQELRYKDFSAIVKRLVVILHEMGIETSSESICNASVLAIHYSKNIALTDGSSPYHYISKLKESNIERLDVNQTDYRNDGHSFRWHCNAYEIIFYDKIRDLEQSRKSSKRAIERDSILQLPLFDSLKQRHKFEVLRMEVRLNKRQKIKQLFASLDIKAGLTFKKLFKPAISKQILLHYLEKLEQRRSLLHDYKPPHDKALLSDLIFYNPKMGPRQIFCLIGLKRVLDVINARELRVLFSDAHQRSLQRLIAETNKLLLPPVHSPFKDLKEQLEKFKALTNRKLTHE